VLHEEAETDPIPIVQLTAPGSEGTFESKDLNIPPTNFVFSAAYKLENMI
jgi:hypothetical protein